jgi:hypothetical protein
MQEHARRQSTRALAAPVAAVVSAFVLMRLSPHALDAQTTRAEREARRSEMQMRQWALRNVEKLKDEPPDDKKVTRPAYADVAQDFEQLQVVNYSLAGAAVEGAPLDYELIKKNSSEVRKRASRLKTFLLLPEVKDEQAQAKALEAQTPEALRAAVASLDALVNSFAWNPVFHQTNVVDLEQSAKAARDLAGIISLSEQINKRASEMSKLAKREAAKK